MCYDTKFSASAQILYAQRFTVIPISALSSAKGSTTICFYCCFMLARIDMMLSRSFALAAMLKCNPLTHAHSHPTHPKSIVDNTSPHNRLNSFLAELTMFIASSFACDTQFVCDCVNNTDSENSVMLTKKFSGGTMHIMMLYNLYCVLHEVF